VCWEKVNPRVAATLASPRIRARTPARTVGQMTIFDELRSTMTDKTTADPLLDRFDVQGLSYPTEVGVIRLACRAEGCAWETETDDDLMRLGELVELARQHWQGEHDADAHYGRGCRCPKLGEGTPEHAPGFLCRPGHETSPVHSGGQNA
jgi:hypothetical protein